MNPFAKYPGIKLNGQFYSKDDILNSDYAVSSKYEKDILEFAKQVFQSESDLKFQTSGSTGKPQEIVFSKRAVALSSQVTNSFFGLENKRILLALPLSFVAGKMVICRAIIGQSEIISRKPSSLPLEKGISFDFIPLTPHQFGSVLENQIDFLPKDAVILLGGGTVTMPLMNKIKTIPNKVFLGFGMTETLTHFAVKSLKTEKTEFEVLDGTSVAADDKGRLRINREGITQGWITTNDIIDLAEKGFTWIGRADNVVNSGGIKIFPEKIEAILSGAIEYEFFVAGIPDEELGERLVLFVEGSKQPDISQIRFEKDYEKPREIRLVNSFIRTSSGKIQRQETIKSILDN